MASPHDKTSRPHRFFQQAPYRLGSQWLEDSALRAFMKRTVPKEIMAEIEPDLERFGWRVVEDIWELGKTCERPENHPRLIHVDGWGNRVDRIVVHPAWVKLQEISAEEGLISIGYVRKQREFSRLYQMVKQYLFASPSAVFGCPLAMTDGAARMFELHAPEPLKSKIMAHLLSRDPAEFWTSGQWMTERTGGSDVSNTETIAIAQPDGSYQLYGYKFFTSATTSKMAIALARIVAPDGSVVAGTRGLSAFFVTIHNDAGELNNIVVHKLKDKFGTRAVPTAELELVGTPGYLLGTAGRGVAAIASMFNVTRIYNSIHSVSSMRRAIAVARDYATRRKAFGKMLRDYSLHMRTLASMEVTFRGSLYFVLDVINIQGRVECGVGSREDNELLRLLTPLIKLFTARLALPIITEGIESLGGLGYLEDASDLPSLFRNAQVGTIWEGTTNILSHDLLRALQHTPGTIDTFAALVRRKIQAPSSSTSSPALANATARVSEGLERIQTFYTSIGGGHKADQIEPISREFAFLMSGVYAGAVLIEHAHWSGSAIDQKVAQRWAIAHIGQLSEIPSDAICAEDKQLALDGWSDAVDVCAVTRKIRAKF